jgi:hypothetical protein
LHDVVLHGDSFGLTQPALNNGVLSTCVEGATSLPTQLTRERTEDGRAPDDST